MYGTEVIMTVAIATFELYILGASICFLKHFGDVSVSSGSLFQDFFSDLVKKKERKFICFKKFLAT